jgi:hypothetical protein
LPAASVSSTVSWTVYFAASLVLVSVCSPMLAGVKSYACGDSAARTAQGAAQVIDSLEPGMTVAFSFHPPATGDHIEMDGRSLSAVWCGRSSTFRTVWQLPTGVLAPGLDYRFRLAGNQVEVFGFV